METTYTIETHGDPLGTVTRLVEYIWQEAKLDGIFVSADTLDEQQAGQHLLDQPEQLQKFNPLFDWTRKEVWSYIRDNDLPYNALHDAGFANRQAFAPIDAAALRQYRFFARLGFFGVEQHSARGAAQFIRAATALLAQPNTSLWLTPQGRFADVREQSPQFKAGLGHLPARIERAVFVPLALEYVFWEERKAEVLARFGAPEIISGNKLSPQEWTHHFEQRLQATQAALAIEAQQRQPADFRTLVHSRSGVGFAYDAWRALRAKLTGQPFHREHGDL